MDKLPDRLATKPNHHPKIRRFSINDSKYLKKESLFSDCKQGGGKESDTPGAQARFHRTDAKRGN
jgi:hypothetical protein